MNRRLLLLLLLVIAVFTAIIFTGFQCSSSDVTSAKLYLKNENYEKADSSLRKELDKNPANTEAWYLLGYTNLKRGELQKALEAYNRGLATPNVEEFRSNIVHDKMYIWQTAVKTGASSFNRISDLQHEGGGKKDSIAYYRKTATEAFKTAITAMPESSVSYKNLAIAQYSAGDYDGEIATLKEGAGKTKDQSFDTLLVDAYSAKYSDLYQQIQKAEAAGNKTEASSLYTQAFGVISDARKSYPDNPDLRSLEIELYVRSGRANEAKPSILEALQKDPGNKVFNYNFGVLLLQTDSVKESIPYFERAIQTDPSYEPALQNAAIAHMRYGDQMKKAASDDMGKKGSKAPDNKAYVEQFKIAVKEIQQLINLNEKTQNNADFWELLASAYANANMTKDAEKAIKKADELRKK